MAGKFGSASVTITLDDGPGGTPRIVTSFILEMGGIKITSNMEGTTAFGDAWEKNLPVGVRKVDNIQLTGDWDTTATTGPHVVMVSPDSDPNGGTRTLVVVFGDSKTFTVETFLMSYEVKGEVNKLTRFTAELQPTGSGVWS